MAYDEFLAERIGRILDEKNILFEERKMMGGLCYMIHNKMCLGVTDNKLMARIGPDFYDKALMMDHCIEMKFTGRPMKGYVWVEPAGIDLEEDLDFWIQKALEFNPKAKSSKKK
jgi:hypothetical protein